MGDYADHNGVGHNMTPAQLDRFVEQRKARDEREGARPLGSEPYNEDEAAESRKNWYTAKRICGQWQVEGADGKIVSGERHARAYAALLNAGATAADAALGRQVREAAAALGVQAEEFVGATPALFKMAQWNSERDDLPSVSTEEFADAVSLWLTARLSPAPAEGEGVANGP